MKIYCSDSDNNNHVLWIRVFLYKNNEIKRFYFLDREKFEIDKLLIELNNKKINFNSKIKILGCNNPKISNDELIKDIMITISNK